MTRTTIKGHDYLVTAQGYKHAEDCPCWKRASEDDETDDLLDMRSQIAWDEEFGHE